MCSAVGKPASVRRENCSFFPYLIVNIDSTPRLRVRCAFALISSNLKTSYFGCRNFPVLSFSLQSFLILVIPQPALHTIYLFFGQRNLRQEPLAHDPPGRRTEPLSSRQILLVSVRHCYFLLSASIVGVIRALIPINISIAPSNPGCSFLPPGFHIYVLSPETIPLRC